MMKIQDFLLKVTSVAFGAALAGAIMLGKPTDSYAAETQDYELIIEDGVVTDYTGTPVNVVIPEGVTEIGEWAFWSCDSLESVIIPEGVTRIGAAAFGDCDSLESIIIPEGVTEICALAFEECDSLSEVEIPSSVTQFGIGAFGRNYNGATPWLLEKQNENPLVIVNQVLLDATAAKGDIVIPDGVTIAEQAFAHSNNAISVKLPSTLTEIPEGLFLDCTSLTNVEIPNSVTKINDDAFAYCTSLTSIEIPDSVTSIGSWAFENCTSLTSIKLPNCTIDSEVFTGCSALKDILFTVLPASVDDILFKIQNG